MRKIFFIILILFSVRAGAQFIKPYFSTLSIENGLPEGYVTASLQDKMGYMWFGTQNGLVRYDGYHLKPYEMPDENGNPLIYCSIQQLHEDRDGILWSYVDKEGLYYFDRKNEAFIRLKMEEESKDFFQGNPNYKWVEDHAGGLHWLMLYNYEKSRSCVVAFDATQKKFEKYSADSKGEQFVAIKEYADLIVNASGQVWLASDSLLSLFDPSSRSFQPWFVIPDTAKNIKFANIIADPVNQEIIWANPFISGIDESKNPYQRKVLQINTRTKEYQVFMNIENDPSSIAGNCSNILTDSLNRIWFLTDVGVSRFNPTKNTFTNYAINLPLSVTGNKTQFYSLAADIEGNLWLGGSYKGLYYLDLKTGNVSFYTHSNDAGSLPDFRSGINKLFFDHSGTLWISMPWSGIAYLDKQKSMFNPVKIEPYQAKASGSMHQADFEIVGNAGDSIFYVTNETGLYAWNYRQNSYKRIDLKNNEVYSQINMVMAGADELIWIGSGGTGLFCYDPLSKSVKNFRNNPLDTTSISSDFIGVLTEDKEGTLWIGTRDKGLCSFNRAGGTFIQYPFIQNNGTMIAKNELDDGTVLSMHFDKEGILWIGTNLGGLNRFDTRTGKFTSYLDLKSGFNCVINIYEDTRNRLWAGTYLSGLFLFDRNTGEKKRYSEKDGLIFNAVFGIAEDSTGNIWSASARGLSKLEPETGRFVNFLVPVGNTNANSILYKESTGRINIASMSGLISFNPERMMANIVPPEVAIESVRYFGPGNKDTIVNAYGSDLIEMQYHENRISFYFTALHYAGSESNRYAYMLEGYEKEWVQSGTQRSATYTNLSPGSYTFRVKASNSDGVWNETGASFIVEILPPWWQTWWAYCIYGILLLAVIMAIHRFQKARTIRLEREKTQRRELEQAKAIEKAYTELKTTQSQLIQSEKMASLGELTAGIAHEIQNPLNFVNNFSEVSIELVEEIKEKIDLVKTQYIASPAASPAASPTVSKSFEEIEEMLVDLASNQQKIGHHGKRADAIVKGMLQHSRTSTGQKEPTDINALADEYLRLAYHGLRAKDKSFNSAMKTDFDETIGLVHVIHQDIGRVLLNLITNAFYAVSDKKNSATYPGSASPGGKQDYQPTVSVSTRKKGPGVIITVADNGNGIPEHIREKIFQPFFTTKPSGQGTGLGLSLSYDIVMAHGGELKVETKEGAGSEFIIILPN